VVEATQEELEMTWLITGASGQLGLAMQTELKTSEIEFLAFDSKALDITSQSAIENVFLKNSPNVVVNCAAWTDVDAAEGSKEQAFAVNSLGARNLAIASKKLGAIFVHISTDYVFSGENNSPWLEDAERNPSSIYGLSKKEGEELVQELYPEGSYLVRTAWLYSPNGKNFAKTMAKLALLGDGEIKVVNDQIGQPTSARGLAKQIKSLVLSKASFGTYHGTNSGSASWFDFAQEIFMLVGEDKSRLTPVVTSEFPRPAKRPQYSVLSHENWNKQGLEEMQVWRKALAEEIPYILLQMKNEEEK
jgi:dTDP-4-dehydrorhamnose reductase